MKMNQMRAILLLLVWGNCTSAMNQPDTQLALVSELNENDLQRGLFLALKENNVKDAAFYLACGADIKKSDSENKTVAHYLVSLGRRGASMRNLFRQNYPDLTLPEERWTVSTFIASQISGAHELLLYGRGAVEALVSPANNNNTPAALPVLAPAPAKPPAGELIAHLIYLFLHDYDKFEVDKKKYFPTDLQRLLAKRLLYNHPLKKLFELKLRNPKITGEDAPLTIPKSALIQGRSNPAGTRIAVLSGNTVNLVDAHDPHQTPVAQLIGHTNEICSALYNPAGDKIVTASGDMVARVWDAETGTLLFPLEGHAAAVNSARFNRTGDKIVTASQDSTVKIWDGNTGNLICTLVHKNPVDSAEFSPTGEQLLTTAHPEQTGYVQLWDVGLGSCIHNSAVRTRGLRISSAHFNKDGTRILINTMSHIMICDAESGVELRTIGRADYSIETIATPIRNAYYNPAGDKIIIIDIYSTINDFPWGIGIFGPNVVRVRTDGILALHYDSFSLEEALLLHCIYETLIQRKLLGNVNKKEPSPSYTPLSFDFNRCPHLQQIFDKLHVKFQAALKPFVVRYENFDTSSEEEVEDE